MTVTCMCVTSTVMYMYCTHVTISWDGRVHLHLNEANAVGQLENMETQERKQEREQEWKQPKDVENNSRHESQVSLN